MQRLSKTKNRLGITQVCNMSDQDVEILFARARWQETSGEPVCPQCGCCDVGRISTRKVWRCRSCRKDFSITSGTIFSGRKLPLKTLLVAVVLFVSGKKGISSLQLSRMIDCEYKSAYVLSQKIRDAICKDIDKVYGLSGDIEVDGAFFGGHTERFNKIDKRTGKLVARRRYGQRRVVVAIRQRGGRTVTLVVKKESDAIFMVRRKVGAEATIHSDLAHAWDSMKDLYRLMRINHSQSFSDGWTHTNHCESLFSLMRRKHMGIHHRMSGKYLHLYAGEMAWRNDFKHMSHDEMVEKTIRTILTTDISRDWSGYWQRSSGSKKLPDNVVRLPSQMEKAA